MVKKLLWVKFTLFLGIAIALAHDGKTRQELASELTHLEENSEKSQEAEATVESASLPVEKTVTLNKMRSPNFYVSVTNSICNDFFFDPLLAGCRWKAKLKKESF